MTVPDDISGNQPEEILLDYRLNLMRNIVFFIDSWWLASEEENNSSKTQ